jgi:chromosome partitioning protein
LLKIAIFNFKGGTGKSTTALNLGAALAKAQQKTLLIDLDGQRTLSFGLGVDGKKPSALDWLNGSKKNIEPIASTIKNLFVLPGDLGMFQLQADRDIFTPSLNSLIPLGFDVILMDCPPGLGVAAVQAILASDRVLLPTLCEPAALKGMSEAVSLIREERQEMPIEVLRTRYRSRLVLTRESDDLLIDAAADLNYRLLHSTIPENVQIAESIAQQQPILAYAPKSVGGKAYLSVAKECLKLWEVK